MKRTIWTKMWLGAALAACSLGVASAARAADDLARFSGTWKTAVSCNGQFLVVASVHDGSGFKNYVILPGASMPVGEGTFTAADGKCTVKEAVGDETQSYLFIDDNTVVCKNSAGQSFFWQRDNSPLPPVIATPGVAALGTTLLPSGTNLAAVNVSRVIDVGRQMAHTWRADAILISAYANGPGNDGTVNVTYAPGAITIVFYSPSATSGLVIASTAPAGTLFAVQTAGTPGQNLLPIPPQALDLTNAVAAARQAGLNGPVAHAQLCVYQKTGTPCLAWALYGQEMYPRVVSAVSGAMLSPFEVVDDKVAYYNQLAAEHARNMRASRGTASGGSGLAWTGGTQAGGSSESTSQDGSTVNQTNEDPDEYNNSVGAQAAFDASNSDAQARFNENCPTVEDQATYTDGN